MKAIEFVTRTRAGATQYGSVSAGEGVRAVQVEPGQELSLHLRQGDIRGYTRDGRDLEITLSDGRIIVLEEYYGFDGEAVSRLFISSNGALHEVSLSEASDGTVYAQYGPTEQWGKWSPSDELIFLDESELAAPIGLGADGDESVTMLGAGILGGTGLLTAAGAGAAAIGVAAVIPTSDEDAPPPIVPKIDQENAIAVGGDGAGPATSEIVITGDAPPNSDVSVTIGDKTVDTTAGADGNWEANFTGGDFPSDGNHSVVAVVTEPDGSTTNLTGPPVTIDTTPPASDVATGTVSTGDITNADEYNSGTEITGTGEAGSSVSVTIEGVTRETTVAADGSWSVTYENGALPTGEYTSTVTVVSTDISGNTSTVTDQITIDTVANDVSVSTAQIEGDGTINNAEIQDGITIVGTATPGAEVVVEIQGVQQTVTATGTGSWTATFDPATLPQGDYDTTVTATSTDAAGNVNSSTGTVHVDTSVTNFAVTSQTGGADMVINAAEAQGGQVVTGTTEIGSTVTVQLGNETVNAVVAADGSWTATFTPAQIPSGTYTTTLISTATDAAGNQTSTTSNVSVDTEVGPLVISAGTIEGDGTINGTERQDGFDVTGSAPAGSEVVVTIQGVQQTVTAGANGTWTANFAAGTLPLGEYDAPITATTTDAAGNSVTTNGTVHVDTSVTNFAVTSQAGGADNVINAAEAQGGLVVTGSSEPGSTVTVQMGNATVNAVVAANGSWTASFTAAQIPSGTYSTTMTATATDAAGNQDIRNSVVQVDTDAGTLTLNAAQIGGDGTINFAEAAAGVLVTGTADPGAVVTVTLDGVAHQVVTGANGVWQTTYTNAEITPGVHDPQVSATITDAAGNSATVDATVHVDTRVDNLNLTPPTIATATDGTDVINFAVAGAGFAVQGTVEPGSTVSVTIGGVTRPATVDANGNWTANFLPGDIPGGEYDANLTVNVTDAAGNTSSVSDTVKVDTLVNALSKSAVPVETDNIVNAQEARDGVTLNGQVEPGSTVVVTVLGKTYNATVDAAGNWTVDIPAGDIPQADQTFAMVITATDAAGNSSSINDTLVIDTLVPDQPDIVGYFREVDGYRSATIETTQDDVEIHQVAAGGAVNQMNLHEVQDAFLGETTYHFLDGAGAPTKIPDGSQLVITGEDNAGNASSTYVVLDEVNTNVVNPSNANLSGFNIETVDLRFGDQSQLTLTEAQLRGLSDNTDNVVVRGGADDTVTILGAQQTGSTQVDGEAHTIYSLGNGASVIVDDDITTVI